MGFITWRQLTRIVAFMDVLVSLVALFLFCLCALNGVGVAAVLTTSREDLMAELNADNIQITIYMFGMWIALSVYASVVILELWASLMLFIVTQCGYELTERLLKAEFWRNVALFHLAAGTLFHTCNNHDLFMVLEAIVRTMFIYVVHNLILDTKATFDMARQIPITVAEKGVVKY